MSNETNHRAEAVKALNECGSTHKTRFVWLIGSIREQFTDLPENPEDGSLILWDRAERRPVVLVDPAYAQALCLETTGEAGAPFTALETWFNGLSSDTLDSEGLPNGQPCAASKLAAIVADETKS